MSVQTPIRLFSSDLDGTLIGEPASTRRFRELWDSLAGEHRPVLVYNSGRTIDDMRGLLAEGLLPTPDFLIGSVGTELFDMAVGAPVGDFSREFRHGWNLSIVEEIVASIPGIERQPPQFLHPYKSSWYLHDAAAEHIGELSARLLEAGVEANVVYSSNRDLDVLPKVADKGHAVKWLCAHLEVPLDSVVVAGDTGNDSAMFLLPGVRGIAVGNAQPDLLDALGELAVFRAGREMADGVIEGLRHHGLRAWPDGDV